MIRLLPFNKLPLTWIQFFRFSMIGIIANIANFTFFTLFTNFGFEPKLVMTVLYFLLSVFCFLCHWLWVFTNDQKLISATSRYIITHLIGYLINLLFLIIFADGLGYPPQLVLAVGIMCVAGFLFFSQKYYVFPSS